MKPATDTEFRHLERSCKLLPKAAKILTADDANPALPITRKMPGFP